MAAPADNARKLRNAAWLWAGFALLVYLGFIAWSVWKRG